MALQTCIIWFYIFRWPSARVESRIGQDQQDFVETRQNFWTRLDRALCVGTCIIDNDFEVLMVDINYPTPVISNMNCCNIK